MPSENVNEARTILLDEDGNILPVPAGTDPHLEKKQNRGQGSGARDRKTTARPTPETKTPAPETHKGGKS